MVSNKISLPIYENMECDDFQSADAFVDNLIEKHSNNSEMTNLMVLEATSLITSVESRSRHLESQSWLVRAWSEATSKNQKIAARNDLDLAKSQYIGQQLLNKLAENNLMTYQMVVALGDKVTRVVDDVNHTRLELAQINQTLATFFSGLRQNLEQKFSALERNDELLFWKETMMFEAVYKGRTYAELSRPEKIICIANDFYHYSQQQWSPRDLAFLKSVLVQVGHNPDEKVTLKEVYQSYQQDSDLLAKLFKGIDDTPQLSDSNELTPTLLAFEKINTLDNDDIHIVDTIMQYAPETPRNEVSLELASNYISKQVGRDLGRELPIFDAVMNFVEDLSINKTLNAAKVDAAIAEKMNTVDRDEHENLKNELKLLKSQASTITRDDINDVLFENKISTIKKITFNASELSQVNNTIIPKGIRGFILGAFNDLEFDKVGLKSLRMRTQSKSIGMSHVWGNFRKTPSERFSTEATITMDFYIGDYFGNPIYVDGLEGLGNDDIAYVTIIFLDLYDELKVDYSNNDSPVSIRNFASGELFKVLDS